MDHAMQRLVDVASSKYDELAQLSYFDQKENYMLYETGEASCIAQQIESID